MSTNATRNTPKWAGVVGISMFVSIFVLFILGALTLSIGSDAGFYFIGLGAFMFPVLFIYTFIMIILSATKWAPAPPPVPQPTTANGGTASGATLASSALINEKAAKRQERATQAANYTTLTKKKHDPLTLWLILAAFGSVFLFAIHPALGFAVFGGSIITLLWRQMKPNSQLRAYSKKYETITAPNIDEKTATETFRGKSAMGNEGNRWVTAMWTKYGKALAGREKETSRFALQNKGEYAALLVGTPDEEINPNLLPSVGSGLWQIRNSIILPDPEDSAYPIHFADLNVISEAEVNNSPSPRMLPSSYAETWFPSDHRLAVYPNKRASMSEWRGTGTPVTPLEPHLDKLYDVVATDDAWARLVLNVNVMERLVNLHPVVLLIDRGKITLMRPNAWVEPDDLRQFTETVRKVARSARAAEA